MTTARVIVQAALEELSVYAPGETVSNPDMARGFYLLNTMISEWRDEYLYPYSITNVTATLTSGVSVYTVGGGQTINATRPEQIVYGPGVITITSVGPTTTLADVVSEVEWITIESISPGFGIPQYFFYDNQFPVGNLNVSPIPNQVGITALLPLLYPFVSFAALATNYTFSPGVEDAITHNLSVYAKPYFATAQLDPDIVTLAGTAKNFLRYSNRNSRVLLARDPGRTGPQMIRPA